MNKCKKKNKLSYNLSILILMVTLCFAMMLGWSISYVFGTGLTQVTDNFIDQLQIDPRKMFDIDHQHGKMQLGKGSCAHHGPNWVSVPANAELGTSHFCVMKFEARNVAGVPTSTPVGMPWAPADLAAANTACTNQIGMRLISHKEQLAIARSAEVTAWNWSSGITGIGKMNDGHSDNAPASALGDIDVTDFCHNTGQICDATIWDSQRRVWRLTNGEEIWDIGGNKCEFRTFDLPYESIWTTDDYISSNELHEAWGGNYNKNEKAGVYMSNLPSTKRIGRTWRQGICNNEESQRGCWTTTNCVGWICFSGCTCPARYINQSTFRCVQ